MLIALAPDVLAQQSMLGIRQGAGLWLHKQGIGQGSLKLTAGQRVTWNKEIFYRNAFEKKWSYEASVSYFSFNYIRMGRRYDRRTEKNEFLKTNFSVQYNVTYPLLGYMIPFMRDMSSFIGFNMSPMISFDKYQTIELDGSETNKSGQNLSMMIGFSYTHIIPVSKKLNITSVLSFATNTFSKYEPATDYIRPNKSISWMGGLGYKL